MAAGTVVMFAPDRDPADWIDVTPPAMSPRGGPVLQRRIAWAQLLQPVFDVDALGCPRCGGRRRILSAITDPTVAARILRCLALPSRAPPLAACLGGVGPPDSVGDVLFGGISEFDFDQSEPSDEDERGA